VAKSWVSRSIEALSDLVWQRSCELCDRPAKHQGLCLACDRRLLASQLPLEQRWGRLPSALVSSAPLFLAWGLYDGSLKRAIAALKYEGHPKLAATLGQGLGRLWLEPGTDRAMATPWQQVDRSAPWVIPIPLHEARLQKRGFNQAELLAKHFCDVTGHRLIPNGLQRIRDTQAQFGLGQGDRAANVQGAFALGPGLGQQRPRSVILLDDIYTSGATVQAASNSLRAGGWTVAAVVVVARSAQRPAPGTHPPTRSAPTRPKRRDS